MSYVRTCQLCNNPSTSNKHRYCDQCREIHKEKQFKKMHRGVSSDQFNQIRIDQEGKCHICKTENENLHIDGMPIRLICQKCRFAVCMIRKRGLPSIMEFLHQVNKYVEESDTAQKS